MRWLVSLGILQTGLLVVAVFFLYQNSTRPTDTGDRYQAPQPALIAAGKADMYPHDCAASPVREEILAVIRDEISRTIAQANSTNDRPELQAPIAEHPLQDSQALAVDLEAMLAIFQSTGRFEASEMARFHAGMARLPSDHRNLILKQLVQSLRDGTVDGQF